MSKTLGGARKGVPMGGLKRDRLDSICLFSKKNERSRCDGYDGEKEKENKRNRKLTGSREAEDNKLKKEGGLSVLLFGRR